MRADIRVLFKFQNNIVHKNGYRPAHLIFENYLTTGLHTYDKETIEDEINGTIKFISPEDYPHCLWIGMEIKMYEGSRNIGIAIVQEIYNEILLK